MSKDLNPMNVIAPIETTVEEIREARTKITTPPWIQSALAGMYVVAEGKDYATVCSVGEYNEDGSIHLAFKNAANNLQFITDAPRYIDFLLAELERRDKEIERLRNER